MSLLKEMKTSNQLNDWEDLLEAKTKKHLSEKQSKYSKVTKHKPVNEDGRPGARTRKHLHLKQLVNFQKLKEKEDVHLVPKINRNAQEEQKSN